MPHPYLSERAFRRYEDTLELVMKNFPSAVWINPDPLAAVTFSCRFRDAIKGFSIHKYSSRIKYDKFMEIFPEIITAVRGENVVIGRRDKLDEKVQQVPVGSVIRADALLDSEEITNPDEEVLKALCLLASRQILQSVTLSGVTLEQVQRHANLYDVEVMEHNGKIIIL